MKLCSFDARSKGQPRTLPYREVVRIGAALLDGLFEQPAGSLCFAVAADPRDRPALLAGDNMLIVILGAKSTDFQGTSRGHPEGAGHSVYADGDCPI